MGSKRLSSSTRCKVTQYTGIELYESVYIIKISDHLEKFTSQFHPLECFTIENHIQISLSVGLFFIFSDTMELISQRKYRLGQKLIRRNKEGQLSLMSYKQLSLYTHSITHLQQFIHKPVIKRFCALSHQSGCISMWWSGKL